MPISIDRREEVLTENWTGALVFLSKMYIFRKEQFSIKFEEKMVNKSNYTALQNE